MESLQASIDFSLADKRKRGDEVIQFHTTRMVPKRIDELIDGGSLYWVIKGNIQVRQYIEEIRPFYRRVWHITLQNCHGAKTDPHGMAAAARFSGVAIPDGR